MTNHKRIDVQFRGTKEERIYARIVASRKGPITLAQHGRNLWQRALDCTCFAAKARKGKK